MGINVHQVLVFLNKKIRFLNCPKYITEHKSGSNVTQKKLQHNNSLRRKHNTQNVIYLLSCNM